ncbi:hypothetical protein [Saccharopolyspora shandongensis]|uniref:hypothetical protein n=1 Tax=Saccharopolyspora shandongensis TaxID=418495 RepID=UPI0033DBEAEE
MAAVAPGASETPEGDDKRMIFTMIDPQLPAEHAPLIDLATAFKLAPTSDPFDPGDGGAC